MKYGDRFKQHASIKSALRSAQGGNTVPLNEIWQKAHDNCSCFLNYSLFQFPTDITDIVEIMYEFLKYYCNLESVVLGGEKI